MANKANSRICLVTSILLLLTLCTSTMGKTIYVDDDAVGTNDGTSWTDAYNFLQDALADANSTEKPVEIRVAQGIHKPDQGKNQTLGDREATFRLINKPYHPKSNNWVGYIIEIASKRIYVAGDTDLTDEMKALEDIDVAILPAGGTYTMNAAEAAEATQYIKPELAIPYHWGDIIGSLSDAETFAQMAVCVVKIMTVGETINSDN